MGSPDGAPDEKPDAPKGDEDYETLKYQLLGPSLTKAGQDAVDQQKVTFAKIELEVIGYKG
jgi:DNA polymerase kappa